MKRLAALLALAVALLPALAGAEPPRQVQIEFSVSSGSMQIGVGRDVLEHDGKKYSITSESQTTGVAAVLYKLDIRRMSRGLVTASGLRPQRFEEVRTRKPARSADFDWEAGRLRLTEGDESDSVALQPNTYDQTSFAYSFAFRPPQQDLIPVSLTDGKRVQDYKYKVVGREKIETPLGELETLHFQKVRDPDDKRGFEFWLSSAHHNLPVRIRYIEKNGRIVDSTVTNITFR